MSGYSQRCTRRVAPCPALLPALAEESIRRADDIASSMPHDGLMIEPAARAEHATKIFGLAHAGVRALDDVALAIPRRRWTAIMGPSGSGKSTLLHCMAGLDVLTAGRTFIGDVDL